ncbi:hypothetical protein [Salinithrix halophila]|uniref:Uncharacterized protein n=1 Tax=Salinithrix halophila TaxID=1485204 RepID=A0ABV8JJ26_9BACL
MIVKMMKQVFGRQEIRTHSGVCKPLTHRGIYDGRDYLRMMLVEEEKRAVKTTLETSGWDDERKGA